MECHTICSLPVGRYSKVHCPKLHPEVCFGVAQSTAIYHETVKSSGTDVIRPVSPRLRPPRRHCKKGSALLCPEGPLSGTIGNQWTGPQRRRTCSFSPSVL